jgi:hypothetical protein
MELVVVVVCVNSSLSQLRTEGRIGERSKGNKREVIERHERMEW